jgi:hypothetical protein
VQQTVTAGGSASYTIIVAPAPAGFSSAVSLSCSALPTGASCAFQPASVTPGTNNTNVSLTLSTRARSAVTTGSAWSGWLWNAAGLLGAAVCFAGLMLRRAGRRRLAWALPAVTLLVTLAALQTGCGGGGGGGSNPPSQGTPAGTFTVSVNGTSGTIQQSVNIILRVQ